MIFPTTYIVCALLGLAGGVLACVAAVQVLRGGDVGRRPLALLQLVVWVLWIGGAALLVAERLEERDWQHLYWVAVAPAVCLFACSGVLLCRDGERRGAALFLGICLCFGLLPLLLAIALPPDPPAPRDIGAPLRRLCDMARWGFGGALPECLSPNTQEESLRGVGHLPREVTVPLGTTLLAARLWIVFCLLALASRLVRPQRVRLALLLVAPLPLALLGSVIADEERVWTSDPALLRSYGPTLLAALLLCAILWLSTSARRRAPS